MPARTIQAFQPNPAIEIQGFNLNAIPWAVGREGKEGGKGGRCSSSTALSSPHPTELPLSPPDAPDHGMLCSDMDRRSRCNEEGDKAVSRAGHRHPFALGTAQKSQTSFRGSPNNLMIPTAPFELPPRALTSEQHSESGVKPEKSLPTSTRVPDFTLSKGSCGYPKRFNPAHVTQRCKTNQNRRQSTWLQGANPYKTQF